MQQVSILNIGDLHFGAIDIKNFEVEFNDYLYPLIMEEEPDIIVLHGDVFDTRVSLDSDASKIGFSLISTLCQISEAIGSHIRVIRGTITHDYSQLDNFKNYEDEYERFKIVNRCSSEVINIDDDTMVNVLFIPEEYPKDYDDYYAEHFYQVDEDGNVTTNFKQYDTILGHGEIDKFAGYVKLLESESFVHSTPLHEADDFLGMLEESNGYCAFGHIHVRLAYRERILSTGSFTRWAHGEEKPKGVYLVKMSRISNDYQWKLDIQFKENNFAPLYKKYNADEEFNVDTSIDIMYNKIIKLVEDNNLTKIRMDFTSFDISPESYSILKGKFVGDKRVDIKSKAKIKPTVTTLIETGEEVVLSEEESALYNDHFDYLNDSTLPCEERLKRYIDEEVNPSKNISIDDIRSITAPTR